MKTLMRRILFCLLLPIFHVQAASTWRSKGGHTFEGDLVKYHPDKSVVLKGVNGKTVEVPLNSLDDESREKALRQAKAKGWSVLAPVFSHQTSSYSLRVFPRKRPIIQMEFKDRGRPLTYGNPEINLLAAEVREKKYYPTELRKFTQTEKSGNRASFKIELENDVVLFLNMEFLSDGIEFRSWREEPDNIPKLDIHFTMEIPRLVKYDMESRTYKGELFPNGIKSDQLDSELEEFLLISKYHDAPSQRHPFSRHHKKLYSAKSFTIQRPNSSADIVVEGPPKRNVGKVGLFLYDGKKLAEGTHIRFGNFHPRKKEMAATFSIRYK